MQEIKNVPELWSDKSECCGCTACASVCPKHAIEMREDEEGFLYPYVDRTKCIYCKRCLSVCMYKGAEWGREVNDE